MGTAMRVRRENTEHDTDTAASKETRPALADNMPLMLPPPPPATDEARGDTASQADTGSDEATQATEKDTDADDETVTIQKVALSELL